MRALILGLGLGLVVIGGCATANGGSDSPDAGGDDVDAAIRIDGAMVDAAMVIDAAMIDAAPPIDGAVVDARIIDAQPIDGAVVDARIIDAQPIDAQPIDAQMLDAAPMCVPPVSGPCDTSPQCGCQSNQSCIVIDNASGNTGCITSGTTQPYQRCTASGNCTRGNDCLDGLCTPYCATVADCPGPYRQCKQVSYTDGGGATQPIPGFLYCTRTCDPLNPALDDTNFDPCGSGLKCLPSTDRASDCYDLGTGSGVQDDFCGITSGDNSLCAAGYLCTSPIGFGFSCAKFCVVGGAACATGTCTRFTTRQYAGPNEIGLCQ